MTNKDDKNWDLISRSVGKVLIHLKQTQLSDDKKRLKNNETTLKLRIPCIIVGILLVIIIFSRTFLFLANIFRARRQLLLVSLTLSV